jgi:hypothetical protein
MRNFYPSRKKGYSHGGFAKRLCARHRVSSVWEPGKRGLISTEHGRIYRRLKDSRGPASSDLVSRKVPPCQLAPHPRSGLISENLM